VKFRRPYLAAGSHRDTLFCFCGMSTFWTNVLHSSLARK